MSSRSNYFANKNTTEGTDFEFKLAVKSYLEDVWNIPHGQAWTDDTIFFNSERDYKLVQPLTGGYFTKHCPDISVRSDIDPFKILFVVELDGRPPEFGGSKHKRNASYHDTQSGQRHDVRRDQDYMDAGIDLVRYSASEANLMGYKWQKVIDWGMLARICSIHGHLNGYANNSRICARCGKE